MAVILTCYYRPKPGGLCTRLFRAIGALLDRGHTVHYLAVEKFPIDHPRCFFHRYPWPVQQSDTLIFWALFHLLAPLILAGIALRHRITHAFAFGPTYAFFMQPLRIFLQIEVTCFLRGNTILSHRLQQRPSWVVSLDKWVEGLALKSNRTVSVSQFLLDTVLKRHPSKHSIERFILPNDLPQPIAKTSRQFGLPLRFAMAGILEPMKNQIHVIDLLGHIPCKSWHLYIYGPGPELARLENSVALNGLEDKVSFMGWTSRKHIWAQTDLLLSSSLYEGMPNAILEAVTNGVPVLASDIPSHRDILPPSQLVPLNDIDSWQAALIAILDNPSPQLLSMAQQQNRFASHLRFDWDEAITDMITGQV